MTRRRAVAMTCALAIVIAVACGDDTTTPPEAPPPDLYGIGGWTEFDLFAVGEAGTILHYRGATVRPVTARWWC